VAAVGGQNPGMNGFGWSYPELASRHRLKFQIFKPQSLTAPIGLPFWALSRNRLNE